MGIGYKGKKDNPRKKDNKDFSITYIFCNGEQTEKNYFEQLKRECQISRMQIKVIASGYNSLSLVKNVQEKIMGKNDKVYVVFDVDALPKGQESNPVNSKEQAVQAIKLCAKCKYVAIVSNECFELWFLLHYNYCDTFIHRDDLCEKMSRLIGRKYDKSDDMYTILPPNSREKAIQHAKKLCESGSPVDAINKNLPYTNVYKLIEDLLPKSTSCV